jgi:dienelactone hydrolase
MADDGAAIDSGANDAGHGEPDATTNPDAGHTGPDAGNSVDAGHEPDAGNSVDAGHGEPDASSNADAGHGGADAGSGADAGHGDAGSSGGGSTPAMIPTPTATCPTIPNTGTGSSVLTYAGHSITVWAGAVPATPGPLVIYWYATAGSPAQAVQALGGQAGINKITGLGGVVVAPNSTTTSGNTTGNGVWYTGDVAQVDEVVACAVQQHRVDPRHIHVLGYSAGALQTVYMWFARSGYVASVLSYSGGDVTIDKTTMQDPSNVPPAVVAHGAMGMDTFGPVDFYNASHTWETDIKNDNGFDIDCNDGSTHGDETTRFSIAPEGIQFFLDHPFKANPDPYANGLPSGWPSYCTIANK